MNAGIINTSGYSFDSVAVDNFTDVPPCTMASIREFGKLRTIVGSGVSVCLFDRINRSAGMNHFLFPRIDDPQKATGRFGNAALIGLHRLLAMPCSTTPGAYIAGGAYCDEFEMDAALENIRIAWKFLLVKEIPIISQHIGGRCPREVIFDVERGEFTARDLMNDGSP